MAAAWLAAALAVPTAAEPVSFTILGSVGVADDSNVYRLSPDEKREFGDALPALSDQRINPQGAINLQVPLGLQNLELRAAVAGRYYDQNTNLDSTEYALLARLAWVAGAVCEGSVLAEQKRRQQALDDLDAPGSNIQRERQLAASGDCDVTPRLRLSATGEYHERTSPDRQRSAIDLEETRFSGRVTQGDPQSFQPFAEVIWRHREQPNFVSFAEGRSGARATILDAGGGMNWAPSPKLLLSGAAYWSRLREDTGRRDRTGFISANATADWEASVKTKFQFYASRELAASPNVGAIAYPEWLVGGLMTWAATPNLTSALRLERRHRDVLRDRTPVLRPDFTRQESDTTVVVDWSLDFAITDPLHARLGVDWRRRTANFEDLRFTARTVSIGLSYRFGGLPFDTGL